MTEADAAYITKLLTDHVLEGPVLELGAGYGGSTCRQQVMAAGLEYSATDMTPSEGVEYVADFSNPSEAAKVFNGKKFGTVLVLNVLEHTFDPLRILDCALDLLLPNGKLVVIVPAVWTLHSYPIDCCRLLPDWYERYAATRKCELRREYFDYVGLGRVNEVVDNEGSRHFPSPSGGTGSWSYWWSRAIHKIFNTYGRGMAFPSHIAIGAVFVRL